jgi:fructuronate reductase
VEHLEKGRMPHHLALTFAAYLCCIAPPAGYDPGPQAAAMADPARARLAADAAAAPSVASYVRTVLDGGLLGGELAQHTEFVDRVAELVDVIVAHGPAAAAREASTVSTA